MKPISNYLSVFACIILCGALPFSCKEKKDDPNQTKALAGLDLMATDRAFSNLSKEEGMKAAFIDYLDSNGVMLKPKQLPIIGANAIDFLVQQDDRDFVMTWDPQHAEVAFSGELGYTYGVFMMQSKLSDEAIYGTYSSVWKKQQDGKWKLLLYSANEGVE